MRVDEMFSNNPNVNGRFGMLLTTLKIGMEYKEADYIFRHNGLGMEISEYGNDSNGAYAEYTLDGVRNSNPKVVVYYEMANRPGKVTNVVFYEQDGTHYGLADMGKKDLVLKLLEVYNIEKRGHDVKIYDDEGSGEEIAVHGINVPMLADCKEIARAVGCYLHVVESFDMVVFEL